MRSKLLIGLILAMLPVTAMAGDRYGRGYYHGGYDRGYRYHDGDRSHFGFSLGFFGSGRSYYYDDYPAYSYSYYAPSYDYCDPPVYYSPPVRYYSYYPRYYVAPRYYAPSYGLRFYYRR